MLGSLLRFFMCMVGVFFLSSCEGESSPSPSVQPIPSGSNKTFAWPLADSVTRFDPVTMTNTSEAIIARQLFDTLVRLDRNLSLAPGIARTWEVDSSGREYVFNLAPGAIFHDGTPLTATHVKRSLERLARAGKDTFLYKHLQLIVGYDAFICGDAQTIEGIETPNPLQLRIRLVRPHAPFLPALSIYQAGIVSIPDNSLKFDGFPRMIGSGPFVLNTVDDKSIVMRPFERFIDGVPLIDALIFGFYVGSNINAAIDDFLAHKLSVVPLFGSVEERIKGKADYKVTYRNKIGLFFYGFNARSNATLTAAMRQSIAQVIDKNHITSTIQMGIRTPAHTIIPLGLAGHRPALDASSTIAILQQSKSLPQRIRMLTAAKNAAVDAELAYFADRLASLGSELQVEYVPDWDKFYKRLAAGDCDMFRLAWYPDTPDLDEMFFPLFHSQGEYNYFGYSNPRVDALLERARAMPRLVDRITIYHEAEDILLSDLPLIPMWHDAMNRAVRSNVHGLDASPFGEIYTSFAHIRIE